MIYAFPYTCPFNSQIFVFIVLVKGYGNTSATSETPSLDPVVVCDA